MPRFKGYSIDQFYRVLDNGCWEWIGSLKPNGYGGIQRERIKHQAHRYVYELHKGKIPAGMILDHLCRFRRCVNPDHLEPVSHSENTKRGCRFVSTPELQEKVRALLLENKISYREMARQLNVSRTIIDNVRANLMKGI